MRIRYNTILFIIPLLLLSALSAFSQTIKIAGTIRDSETREPLAFATVFLLNSMKGTSTDVNGTFVLSTTVPADTVIFSSVGYISMKMALSEERIDWQVMLEAEVFELEDVTIVAGENPADDVVKKIIANKDSHNKEKLSSYSYEVYNKMEFDADNVSDKISSKKIFKPFAFAFEHIDTTGEKPLLPLLMTESLSDFYFQHSPAVKKEIVKASKISGLENESISQFLGSMYQQINIYNNFINLFDVSFVSPFNNNALFFYKYYIIDSTEMENGMAYKLKFKPRRPGEATLNGFFWVDMSDFAITQISLSIHEKANINFIEQFSFGQEFQKVDAAHWMPANESLILDFKMPMGKMVGIVGKKFTSYKNFEIDSLINPEEFVTARNVEYNDDVLSHSDTFWMAHRHVELTPHQEQVYAMIDSIQNTRAYKTYFSLVNTFGTGYWTNGNFEIGPFYNFVSSNIAEGTRYRFGGRTSNAFSTKVMAYGYVAYGATDRNWKYNGGLLYMLSKTPRSSINVDVLNDWEFSGNEFTELGTDNVFSTFFRRSSLPQKFVKMQSIKAEFEKEWNTGFSQRLSVTHKNVSPWFNYSFTPEFGEGQENTPINITEIGLSLRFASQEKFYTGEFLRTSFGSKYPIVEVKYALGIKGLLGSQFEYFRMMLEVSDRFKMPYIGETEYHFTAGKILGELPSVALFNARGNETYYSNPETFSGIYNYEFVSDAFAQLFVTQHLGGFLFNKIPVIQKLKWRTLLTGKVLYGSISPANEYANQFNYFIVPDQKPYAEAGVGVENIFRILRVDAFWTLSYLDRSTAVPFGVRGSIQLSF